MVIEALLHKNRKLVREVQPYLLSEPDLEARVMKLKANFTTLYQAPPEFAARAPARYEIIGSNTDYNYGHIVAMAIGKTCLSAYRRNDLSIVRVYSNNYPTDKPLEFSVLDLQEGKITSFEEDQSKQWSKYTQAIITAFVQNGGHIQGMDILLESNVPSAGGVSSSAAYEATIVEGLTELYHSPDTSPIYKAQIIRKAEYLLGKRSGLIDKLTSFIGNEISFDFHPEAKQLYENIDIHSFLERNNAGFYVITDPVDKPEEKPKKFRERKESCERVTQYINANRLLGQRRIQGICDITIAEYMTIIDLIPNDVDAHRALYVLHEDQRVIRAVDAIKKNDIYKLGDILNESGREAQSNFQISEGSPQLDFVLDFLRSHQPEVLGVRNMGGGFNPTSLILGNRSTIEIVLKDLNSAYLEKFGHSLDVLKTSSSKGASIIRY